MTTASVTTKFFLNKKFFLYVKRSNQLEKSAEIIKLFGGQLETFLDLDVSYVLTDVPKSEWPPDGTDIMLRKAVDHGVKLMSLSDLTLFCSNYIASQSSSDGDDETKASIKNLRPPFIKFEDTKGQYAPTVKEFLQWPELRLAPFNELGYTNLQVGKSFFNDNAGSEHGSTRTPVVTNEILNANNNNVVHRGVKRRQTVYCEICNRKVDEKIEDHILTPAHLTCTEKQDWRDVNSVIDSLPSLSTLNMRRLTNLTQSNGLGHQEFFCLHKMESVSQLFLNSK